MIALVIVLAGICGFLSGRVSVTPCKTASDSPRPIRPPTRLPRESIGSRHTTIIGGDRSRADELAEDGALLLRPVDPGRVLLFESEDAAQARLAIERFVGAVRKDLVTDQGRAMARISQLDLRWRMEGSGDERVLRVVVMPAHPYAYVGAAGQLAQAVGEWTIVNDAFPETIRDTDGQLLCATAIHMPVTSPSMPLFEAARAEFKARGLVLKSEEIVLAMVAEVVRDAEGTLLWSFAWSADQEDGTLGIRHHAEPFDTQGERTLLLAILERAYGMKVHIARP